MTKITYQTSSSPQETLRIRYQIYVEAVTSMGDKPKTFAQWLNS